MRESICIAASILYAQISTAQYFPQGGSCPLDTICPAEPPSSATCPNPTTDFPGFNLTALQSTSLYQSGPFDIINCGPDDADEVIASWLKDMQKLAVSTSNNAKLGIRSRYGYRAFFKSHANVPKVVSVYDSIAQGATPFKSGCSANKRPAVVCINQQPEIPDALRNVCNHARAFVTTDSPHAVFMCPVLAGLPTIQDGRLTCPTLVSNKLVPNGSDLALNPLSILMEEFAQIYTNLDENFVEKYTIQDAVDLSEQDSLVNGPTYGFYAAAVSKKCREWPKMD